MSRGAAGRGSRLLWTLIPALLFLVAGRLPLPGVPGDVLLHLTGDVERFTGVPTIGLFALGITPAIIAYVVVELFAFLVPPLRRLRHGGPEGRRKLDRSARVLAIVLAAVQAWGIAASLSVAASQEPLLADASPLRTTLIAVASLLGGFCISLVIADFVTRRGLVNGIVLLSSLSFVSAALHDLRAGIAGASMLGALSVRSAVMLVLGVGIVVVATWFGLRGSGDARVEVVPETPHEPPSPYRDARALALRPWIPIPSSSFAAFVLAGELLALPAAAIAYGVPLQGLADALSRGSGPLFFVLYSGVTAVLVALFALLLHRPSEMLELAQRLGLPETASAREGAARARRRALGPTMLFFAALLAGGTLVARSELSVAVLTLPVVIALVMDGARAFREAGRPDLVPIWEERRASAVPVLRAALEAEGIEVATSGMALLSLCQIFVPYAPARILVREADAPHAEAILRHLLVGDAAPDRRPPSPVPTPERSSPITPKKRMLALGVVTAIGIAGLGLAAKPSTPAASGPIHHAELEVSLVDDENEAIEQLREADVPEGIDFRLETVPTGRDAVGSNRTRRATYACLYLRAGESLDAAIARGQAWAASIALPPGARIVWGPVVDWEPETDRQTITGVRTYVVVGDPILRSADIEEAATSVSKSGPMPEVHVAITLANSGAGRFAQATKQNINRRIAIIVDGRVNSAPVVRSEITGGRMSLTMGAGDPEAQLVDAKKLAESLSPR